MLAAVVCEILPNVDLLLANPWHPKYYRISPTDNIAYGGSQ